MSETVACLVAESPAAAPDMLSFVRWIEGFVQCGSVLLVVMVVKQVMPDA